MRIALRKSIPLIGGRSPVDAQFRNPRSPLSQALAGTLSNRAWRSLITDINTQTRPLALVKPGRSLGGAWIDRFVAEGKSVSLCADCGKKYGDWQSRYDYEPRAARELTDCDGCGRELMTCTGYYKRICPKPS